MNYFKDDKSYNSLPFMTAQLFLLAGFAAAQPLYNSLGAKASFFIAHGSDSVDILLLTFLLLIPLPAVLSGLLSLLWLISRQAARGFHLLLILILSFLMLLPAGKMAGMTTALPIILSAVAGSLGITLLYLFLGRFREFLTYLSLGVIVLPLFFLLFTPVKKLAFPRITEVTSSQVKGNYQPPIILIVFDEFPTTSLLNSEGNIDGLRYPHFAALAREATWFRQYTSISDSTVAAVPAILTGKYPDLPRFRHVLPLLADNKENLFTWLNGTYTVKASETLTRLAPPECHLNLSPDIPRRERMKLILRDIAYLYLNIVAPPDLAAHLPSVSDTWSGFGSVKQPLPETGAATFKYWQKYWKTRVTDNHSLRFRRFIRSIFPSDKPTFYFMHILLPHYPWRYAPSGRVYTLANDGFRGLEKSSNRWTGSKYAVSHTHLRHLMQVGFADKMVGRLAEHLKKAGVFDSSLIIITADHGVSFRKNVHKRSFSRENMADIIYVPLLIKKPFQKSGLTTDIPVQSVDIVPTIAAATGLTLPWKSKGYDAFGPDEGRRKKITVFTFYGTPRSEDYKPLTLPELLESVKLRAERFGTGKDFESDRRIGPHDDLIGKAIKDFRIAENDEFPLQLDQEQLLTAVDWRSGFLPCLVSGRMDNSRKGKRPGDLIISVNGIIQGSAVGDRASSGKTEFYLLLPENCFRQGFNNVEVFSVQKKKGDMTLIPCKKQIPKAVGKPKPD